MNAASGILALVLTFPVAASAAGHGKRDHDISLTGASTTDVHTGGSAPGSATATSSDAHVVTLELYCGLGGQYICRTPQQCSENSTDGYIYDVIRDGEPAGQTCVTEAAANDQAIITPGQVLRAFRSLEWPSSQLLIEPPGGATLVNFATNFHTDNDDPLRQSVTLLGQRVTIEATPTTYTWHFGDGASTATDRPGSAYPDLDIVHDYLVAGSTTPSVDTTYTGRYQIAGGPWVTIPESLTVTGASEALTVREARPTLVQP